MTFVSLSKIFIFHEMKKIQGDFSWSWWISICFVVFFSVFIVMFFTNIHRENNSKFGMWKNDKYRYIS